MEKCIINRLTDLVYGLESRPEYVEKSNLSFQLGRYGNCVMVNIIREGSCNFCLTVSRDKDQCYYGIIRPYLAKYADMEYALEIIDNRAEIMDIVDEWVKIIN